MGDLSLLAQQPQVTVTVPGQRVSEGYFEYSATSWTLVGPRGFVRFGPQAPVVSPFASFGNSASGLGLYHFGRGFQAEFFGQWSQGLRRSMISQTGEITVPSGSWGIIGDQALTPFVAGFVPVVGGPPGGLVGDSAMPGLFFSSGMPSVFPGLPPALVSADGSFTVPSRLKTPSPDVGQGSEEVPLPNRADSHPGVRLSPGKPEEALVLGGPGLAASGTSSPARIGGPLPQSASSAEYVGMSVDEARRRYEAEIAERNALASEYLRQAELALAAGKAEVAKVYLRLAARKASGQLRDTALQKLESLEQSRQDRRAP